MIRRTRIGIKLPHHTARGRAPQETRHRGCGGEQGASGLPSVGADGKGKEQRQPEPMDSGKGRRTQLEAPGSELQLKVNYQHKGRGRNIALFTGTFPHLPYKRERQPELCFGLRFIHLVRRRSSPPCRARPGALHFTVRHLSRGQGGRSCPGHNTRSPSRPKGRKTPTGQSSPLCLRCSFTTPNQRPPRHTA